MVEGAITTEAMVTGTVGEAIGVVVGGDTQGVIGGVGDPCGESTLSAPLTLPRRNPTESAIPTSNAQPVGSASERSTM